MKLIVLKQPQKRTIEVDHDWIEHNDDIDNVKYFLHIPNSMFVITYIKEKKQTFVFNSLSVFFSEEPLSNNFKELKRQEVLIPPFGNAGSLAAVCLTLEKNKYRSLRSLKNAVIAQYWQSTFTCYRDYLKDKPAFLRKWEKNGSEFKIYKEIKKRIRSKSIIGYGGFTTEPLIKVENIKTHPKRGKRFLYYKKNIEIVSE